MSAKEDKKRDRMDRENELYMQDEKEKATLTIAKIKIGRELGDAIDELSILRCREEWSSIHGLLSRAIQMLRQVKPCKASFNLSCAMAHGDLCAWQRGHLVRIIDRMDEELRT